MKYRINTANIIAIILVFAFSLMFWVIGCSLYNSDDTGDNTVLFENPYDWIGQQHNASLDYVYKNLKVQLPEKENLSSTALDLVSVYFKNQGYENVEQIIFETLNHYNPDNSELKKVSSYNSILDSMIATCDLTNEQREYLYQLSGLADQGLSMEELESSVNAVAAEAYTNLGETESIVVLAASSVMINSTEYWNENGDDWVNLVLSDTVLTKAAYVINWEEVTKWDIAGAVGGAAGDVAGGPAGMATGALTTAAVTSTADVVYQILDYYW